MSGFMDKIRSFSKDRTNERSRGTERGTGDEQHSRGREGSHLNPDFAESNPGRLTPPDHAPYAPSPSHTNGTETFILSGRGGFGNRASSRGRAANVVLGTDDELPSDVATARSRSRSKSRQRGIEYGRGGAGNRMRSQSRDPAMKEREKTMAEEDDNVIAQYEKAHKDDVGTVGRGGAGNVGPTHQS